VNGLVEAEGQRHSRNCELLLMAIPPENRYIGHMDEKQKSELEAEDWPSTIRTRKELDAALEAGEASGVSARTFDEAVEAGIARAKNG